MEAKEQLRLRQIEHLAALAERYKLIKAFQAREDRQDNHGNFIPDEQDAAMCKAYVTRAYDVIQSVVTPTSVYATQAKAIYESADEVWNETVAAEHMALLAEELHSDLVLGSLDSYVGLLHAEIFDDFISMAQHLNDEGYKDAAAVICGGTLESHLRRLCSKHGIDINENGKSKKAQRLNQDLGKVAYSVYDQKMVTAWLDLRNSAAHGNYDHYSSEQVQQFIDWLEDFIKRNPA